MRNRHGKKEAEDRFEREIELQTTQITFRSTTGPQIQRTPQSFNVSPKRPAAAAPVEAQKNSDVKCDSTVELLRLLQANIQSLTTKFDSFETTITNKIEQISEGYEKLEQKVKA